MKISVSILFLLTLLGLQAVAMKLQVSSPGGSYTLESEALRWKLTGRGRAINFKEKACAKAVWEDFRQRIDTKVTGGYARLPDSLEKFPKGLQTVHFDYNGKSFRIPVGSELGVFLDGLPDTLIVTRRQEDIFCQVGNK